MENIEQAIERAKARQNAPLQKDGRGATRPAPTPDQSAVARRADNDSTIALSDAVLQSNRILSHVITDPRARSFDMLRTQVLQLMDAKEWRVLAVTSPSPNCGKTVTSTNLAISIARQRERSVLLVDLDLQKANIANVLGLRLVNEGVVGVLSGQTSLADAVTRVAIDRTQLSVLPAASTVGSSELMASRQMVELIEALRRDYHSHIVVIDLPPILAGDEVLSILPHVDAVLLVAAVGVSTIAEIEQCDRHLRGTEVARVVLNKVAEPPRNYYNYY